MQKIFGMDKINQSISEQHLHQQTEPHIVVAILTEAEIQTRQQQRTQLLLRLSRLSYHVMMELVNSTA